MGYGVPAVFFFLIYYYYYYLLFIIFSSSFVEYHAVALEQKFTGGRQHIGIQLR